MSDSSTILLVDDDEAVRKVLSFPLERDEDHGERRAVETAVDGTRERAAPRPPAPPCRWQSAAHRGL